MPAPTTRLWATDEVLSANNMRTSINGPIDYLIGRATLGTDDAIELEESVEFPSGNHYLRLPRGTTGQRPSSPAAGMVRWNETADVVDLYDGSAWRGMLDDGVVTYATLNAAGDVGNGGGATGSGRPCSRLLDIVGYRISMTIEYLESAGTTFGQTTNLPLAIRLI